MDVSGEAHEGPKPGSIALKEGSGRTELVLQAVLAVALGLVVPVFVAIGHTILAAAGNTEPVTGAEAVASVVSVALAGAYAWALVATSGRPNKVEVLATMLRITHPGFRQPWSIPKKAVRAVVIEQEGAEGASVNRRLVPQIRTGIDDNRPNVTVLFTRPIDTPGGSVAGWTSRFLMSGRKGVKGLRLTTTDPVAAEAALADWGVVRALDPAMLPTDLAEDESLPRWAQWAMLLGITAIVVAMVLLAIAS